MSYFCSIDTNNQQKNIHITITFPPPDWVCFPSGLNQHRIKDKITKFRSFESSVKKKNTIRNSSCNLVNISQRSETTVKLFSQNRGEPPDTFIPPFGNKNQNVPLASLHYPSMCLGSKSQNTRIMGYRQCVPEERTLCSGFLCVLMQSLFVYLLSVF